MIFKIPYTSFLMAALLTLWAGSFFFFYSLVEAQWIYNVLIIPAVQRNDSAYTGTRIDSLEDSFPTQIIPEYWVEFSVLSSRSGLDNSIKEGEGLSVPSKIQCMLFTYMGFLIEIYLTHNIVPSPCHQMPVAPLYKPPQDNQKGLQKLPNVP